MSITNRHEGFTLLEVIISLGISMSLLLIIIKVNSEVINDYCSNSKESILEDNFDNAMLNLDNIINGYEVSDIKAENNQIIIKYDFDFEKDYYKIRKIFFSSNKLMVSTINHDSKGISSGKNVILNNVKEFNVYTKKSLIYFEIITELGESRIRCI